jgi:hypothetical protein
MGLIRKPNLRAMIGKGPSNMGRIHHSPWFERLRCALAASIVALFAAAPALAADAVELPVSRVKPTIEDYLAVYDVLQRYRLGLAKHDKTMQDSAFWVPPKPMTPLPGMVLLSGAGGPSWDELRKMPGFVDTWDLPLDSYIHFESASRATHYEYYIPIYPQPEKKVEGGNEADLPYWARRNSVVGWPGHYEDILEKRHGEWRILDRKIMMNQK